MQPLMTCLALGCCAALTAQTPDAALAVSAETRAAVIAPVIWSLTDIETVGGMKPEVGGRPRALGAAECGPGLWFDGVDDGLWLPVNPIAGNAAFTIEVLIRPDAGGPEEQRYFHFEDAAGSRGLLELRMLGAEAWCLDAFLKSGAAKLALIDRAKAHPAGRWTWVALRYDGRMMSAWVDGVKEMEGPIAFGPMGPGRTSLGTRQDRRSWFRGALREVRISAEAVPAERMQRAVE